MGLFFQMMSYVNDDGVRAEKKGTFELQCGLVVKNVLPSRREEKFRNDDGDIRVRVVAMNRVDASQKQRAAMSGTATRPEPNLLSQFDSFSFSELSTPDTIYKQQANDGRWLCRSWEIVGDSTPRPQECQLKFLQ
jgi:hypothetical protein